jgi:triosephosphate isomerase
MRKLLIAGNWKMHMPNHEAVSLARQLRVRLMGIHRADMLVCPPATALTAVAEMLKDSEIALGAQNLHDQVSGAYTGEISGEMIRSAGAGWVLIGHSERRQFFGDTNEWVANKVQAALSAGLHPVLCVGETLEEREAGRLETVLRAQLEAGLSSLDATLMASMTVAYEPVWAIGTGVVATPAQAQEAHKLLRGWVSGLFDSKVASELRILYGGSVKPDNAGELLGQPDIDGALVGGASLKAEDFSQIVQVADSVVK